MATLSWDALQPRGGADGTTCWTLRVLQPSVEVAHATPLLAAAGVATLALPCLLSSPPASAHCALFHALNVAAVADERDESGASRADALSEHVGQLAQALADGPISSRLCALSALRAVLDEPGVRCRAVTHPPAALLDALVRVATANAPLAEPPRSADAFFSASPAFWGHALRQEAVLPARATNKDALATLDALCVLHALHCLNALLHAVAEDSEASAAKLAGALLRRDVGAATAAWSTPQTYGVTVLPVSIPTARVPLPCRDAAVCGVLLVSRGRAVALQLAAELMRRGLREDSVKDPRTPYPPLTSPEAAAIKPHEMLLSRLLLLGMEVFMRDRPEAAASIDSSTRAAAAVLLAVLLELSAALRHKEAHAKEAIMLLDNGVLDTLVALVRSGGGLCAAARAAALAAAAELAVLVPSAKRLSSFTALLAELLALQGDGDTILRDAAVHAIGKLVPFAELRPFMRDQRAQLTSLATSAPGCGADAVLRATKAPPSATLAANATSFPDRTTRVSLAASAAPDIGALAAQLMARLNRGAAEAAASAPAARAFAARPTCAACGAVKLASALKRCSACNSVLYCDAACQKGHWKKHKAACRAAAEAARQQQQ